MIITNMCLLLEVLSIVICLHHLYNEKVSFDIATISLLSIDMIIMTMINYLGLPKMYTIVIYPIIILYCGVRFGFEVKQLVINIVLCVILVGGMQMIGALLSYCLFRTQNFSDLKLLLVNCVVFFALIVFLSFVKFERLVRYLCNNGKMIFFVITVCMAWISVWILHYKNLKSIELKQEIMLFLSMALVLVLAEQLSKYKIKAKETEIELKMHQLYSESFQGLIDNIRIKQHEFDNHINAIYGQHFSNLTYDELVEAQKNYCKVVVKDNRFNKLLAQDNPVIRGFLFGRFVELDKMGIEINYQVSIKELDIGVPAYKLVEILGDLMNNAAEALALDAERHKLFVGIVESDEFYIEVRNESQYIEYDVLEKFFDVRYSKKGENRGLGLYNVKQICEEFKLDIMLQNIEIEGVNWLSFKIWK